MTTQDIVQLSEPTNDPASEPECSRQYSKPEHHGRLQKQRQHQETKNSSHVTLRDYQLEFFIPRFA